MASLAGPAAAREDAERQDLPRVPMGFALVEVPRDAVDPEGIRAISGAPWYIVSNVQEHMTGNLELLTDYSAIRPSHAVRTHTGAILQAWGKGSLKKKGFCIPDISYVPGLNKNVVSISQFLDSGLIVEFDINGCIIKRTHDSAVGWISYLWG